MTDAAIQSLSLVVIALFSMIGTVTMGYFSYLTSRNAKAAVETTKVTQAIALETKEIALKTELNTNSMKDALVETTRVAATLKGRQDERIAGDERKASEAIGRAEVRASTVAATIVANGKLDAIVSEAIGTEKGPTTAQTKAAEATVEAAAATVDAADETAKAAAKTTAAMKGDKS